MPILDLIKQADQGGWPFGEADPSLGASDEDCSQPGRFAADLQEQQTTRRRFNEWLYYYRPVRRSRDHITILPG
jgi:hypothetical protein